MALQIMADSRTNCADGATSHRHGVRAKCSVNHLLDEGALPALMQPDVETSNFPHERKELVGCESMAQFLESLHGFLPRGDDTDQRLQPLLLVHIRQAAPVAQLPSAGW